MQLHGQDVQACAEPSGRVDPCARPEQNTGAERKAFGLAMEVGDSSWIRLNSPLNAPFNAFYVETWRVVDRRDIVVRNRAGKRQVIGYQVIECLGALDFLRTGEAAGLAPLPALRGRRARPAAGGSRPGGGAPSAGWSHRYRYPNGNRPGRRRRSAVTGDLGICGRFRPQFCCKLCVRNGIPARGRSERQNACIER